MRFCPVDGFAVVPVTEHREPWVGRLLMGQFQIQAVCGQGATGTVYRASQVGMERQVAVKVLRADLLKDPDVIKRFVREARAGAKISHPNIATVHMVGQTEDGVPFIVMEYIDGRSLSALLEKGRRLGLGKIVHLSSQIAAALTEAHAQGIVHRDLKPENILVSERRGQPEVVKLVDFGIAKILVSYAPGEDAISRMGTVFGTPHYIAPEQASGQAVDGRADLYSLGCIIYQMATGRVPFDGQAGLQVLLSQVRDPVTDPREHNPKLSDELAGLILGLLEKDPAARPQTAKEVRAALLAIGSGAEKASTRDDRRADSDDDDDEDDLTADGSDDDGPSLDAWASGPHDDAQPPERPRNPPVSARRPASGKANLPKSGRRGDGAARNPPRSGRPVSAARPRHVEPESPSLRRPREIIDDDHERVGEPFHKRHATPLLGVLGAIALGLLFGVMYAQMRTPPATTPAAVPSPVPAAVTPPVPLTNRPSSAPRPAAPLARPPAVAKPGVVPSTPVSAAAPTIPATTSLPATSPAAAPAPMAAPAPAAPTAAPAPAVVAPQPADKSADKSADKPADKSADKPADKLADKPVDKSDKLTDKPADKPADKPVDKSDKPTDKSADKPADKSDKPTDKPADKPADKPTDKPADKPADKPTDEPAAESDPYGGLK
ncbi:MAG: protein kinase [Myxococcales bacterium]|nr:protein kinase [Myxococcales bacterium]